MIFKHLSPYMVYLVLAYINIASFPIILYLKKNSFINAVNKDNYVLQKVAQPNVSAK